jgi:hypothetical protein
MNRMPTSMTGRDAPFPFAATSGDDDLFPWPWRLHALASSPAVDGRVNSSPPHGYSERPGRGTYQAHRIGTVLLITAEGDLPNQNQFVDIRELPWKIYPPQFGLFFYTPAVVLAAIRHFHFTKQFGFPPKVPEVTINDVDGPHRVRIEDIESDAFSLVKAAAPQGAEPRNPVELGIGETLQDALDNAVAGLPANNPRVADGFVVYAVLEAGRFRGGIAGIDCHYAKVEARFGTAPP